MFHVIIFNKKIAFEDVLSLNPFGLYQDFQNHHITSGKLNVNQHIFYSSFHLITMIIVNVLVSLYYPNFRELSLMVTWTHYFMDHIHLFRRK